MHMWVHSWYCYNVHIFGKAKQKNPGKEQKENPQHKFLGKSSNYCMAYLSPSDAYNGKFGNSLFGMLCINNVNITIEWGTLQI